MFASATVHDAPAWLRKYETRASFGFSTLSRRTFSEGELIAKAFVSEVSILSPGVKPAEPLAEVLLFRPAEALRSPATGSGPSSDRASSSAESSYKYRPRVWDELEQRVGYRITDENFEAAIVQANRSPIDKAYDELVAAKQLSPQRIYRPNIGQVLGVR